jgi:hypothetical protein
MGGKLMDSMITLNDQVIATGWLAGALVVGFIVCIYFIGFIMGRTR